MDLSKIDFEFSCFIKTCVLWEMSPSQAAQIFTVQVVRRY